MAAFSSASFSIAAFSNASFSLDGSASSGPGGSGKKYKRPANTSHLDLATWAKNKKKLKARIQKVQEQIQSKRQQMEFVPFESVAPIARELAALQKRLLEMLAELDWMNKEAEKAEEMEVMAIYLATRILH